MGKNKLEQMLHALKTTEKQEKLPDELIAALKESDMIVPAIMPPGTDPQVLRKLMEYSDKNMGIPPEANPQPCVLQNPEGKKFLPVFSSEEELKNAPEGTKFPLLMTIPFPSCIQLLKQTEELTGIVVNPFSHNILFTPNEKEQTTNNVQITVEQFHHLTRQRMESSHLPMMLFQKKDELFLDIRKRQGEALKELYDEIYDTEIACPYTADDFEIMSLQITEDMQVMQITMPKKNRFPMTCPNVIVVWNETTKTISYYAIVAKTEEERHIMQVLPDGKPDDLGEAPAEGSELSYVIERIKNEK